MDSEANVSFCSFMNNTGYDGVSGGVYPCWHSGDNSTTVFIKFCNIINCRQKGGELIFTGGPNLYLYECSICQNTVQKTFYANYYPKFIIIDQCYIENPTFTYQADSIKQINNSLNDPIVFIVSHLSSAQCEAEIGLKVGKIKVKVYITSCQTNLSSSILLYMIIPVELESN